MILEVTSFALLTAVQSVITSLSFCGYVDMNCEQGTNVCNEVCDTLVPCDRMTCDQYDQLTSVGVGRSRECAFNPTYSVYVSGTCDDDGTQAPSCENYDLCVTDCVGSNADCEEPCFQYGLDMNTIGLGFHAIGFADCDALCSSNPYGFQYWGECFNNTRGGQYMPPGRVYTTITCNMDSSNDDCTSDYTGSSIDTSNHTGSSNVTSIHTGSNNNMKIGMIIGIVVGAVVVVGVIVAAVIKRKSKETL